MGFPSDPRKTLTELDAILRDPNLPKSCRGDAELAVIAFLQGCERQGTLNAIGTKDLIRREQAFVEAHDRHKARDRVAYDLGMRLAGVDLSAAAKAFKAASRSRDERLASRAERELAVLPYRHQPLDLAFTAVDGRRVDLANLRGKVVMVDFWATWCGPCRREIPAVREVYRRFHERGFEIVGISLDERKQALRDYLAKEEMSWPQYFDGNGWDNNISRRFAIFSIPTMWLLDQTGRVVSTEIDGDNLESHLQRLLDH